MTDTNDKVRRTVPKIGVYLNEEAEALVAKYRGKINFSRMFLDALRREDRERRLESVADQLCGISMP